MYGYTAYMQKSLLRVIFVSTALLLVGCSTEKVPDAREEFYKAHVQSIVRETEDNSAGVLRTVQVADIKILSGPNVGKVIQLENGVLDGREDMKLHKGDKVVLQTLIKASGETEYFVREKYRLPSMMVLGGVFIALIILLSGFRGFLSLLGLVLSIAVLLFYVVPNIMEGKNPLVISLIGSFFIACTSLYLAHGFHKRTTVALISTLITLTLAALLSYIFVHVAQLFGMGSEESVFLQMGALQNVNLRGLLLGGIVIGALGVLDDITTAQTAAVYEIKKANPRISDAALLKAGMAIGHEHISSLINTLALAYAGASLPLLLLFEIDSAYPLWVTLNSEFLAEEIIRTLVGSVTLLFAVPISTFLATYFLRHVDVSKLHSSMHMHHH